MRQITAIAFLVLHLIGNTELHQLMRLPVFFQHYSQHQQIDPDINLIDFIVLHYFKSPSTHSVTHEDQQLPFKNYDCEARTVTFDLPYQTFCESVQEVFNTDIQLPYQSPFILLSFCSTIWQPPRI